MNTAEKAGQALVYLQKYAPDVYAKYLEFTSAAAAGDHLSSKMMELILVGCSVMSQCEMCISLHIQNAAMAGATREEIVQAAFMAVAMGGSPKMMYMMYVFEEVEDLFE